MPILQEVNSIQAETLRPNDPYRINSEEVLSDCVEAIKQHPFEGGVYELHSDAELLDHLLNINPGNLSEVQLPILSDALEFEFHTYMEVLNLGNSGRQGKSSFSSWVSKIKKPQWLQKRISKLWEMQFYVIDMAFCVKKIPTVHLSVFALTRSHFCTLRVLSIL